MSDRSGLTIESVSHSYADVEAVCDATLTIPAGEIHCLLGPSGSGKSTLLRVIAGLERQQRGTVTIDGEVVSNNTRHQPAEKRPVGFVFQDFALFPHLSAVKNVLFGMADRRSSRSRENATQLLTDVGLAGHMNSMPHTLSGGEQQRVALARALARTPQVMLLDEPFSGLDVQLRADVRETTLRVLRAANVATVMVTHDPAEAISCADRISVMHRGYIVQTDDPRQIYHYPADDRTAETFGIVNRIPVEARDGRLVTEYGDWPLGVSNSETSAIAYVRPEQLALQAVSGTDSSGASHVARIVHEGATTLHIINRDSDTPLFVRTLSTDHIAVDAPVSVSIREGIC